MKLVGLALGEVVDAREGGLGAETLSRAPQLERWGEIFWSIIIYFLRILNALSSLLQVQGSQYVLVL